MAVGIIKSQNAGLLGVEHFIHKGRVRSALLQLLDFETHIVGRRSCTADKIIFLVRSIHIGGYGPRLQEKVLQLSSVRSI